MESATKETILSIIKGIIIVWFMFYFFKSLNKNSGKYEGLTAKEWYNEYDVLQGCAENVYDGLQYVEDQRDLDIQISNLYSCF